MNSVKLVGFSQFSDVSAGREEVSTTREYRYPDEVLVVTTGLRRDSGKPPAITGLRVQPMKLAAIRALDFALTGKSPIHYAFLAWALLTPVLMIWALVALFLSATMRRKWLWAIFIVLGIGQVSLNWATGEIASFMPIGVQLLGVGLVKQNAVFAPWILSVSLPVGAVLVLIRSRRRPPVDVAAASPG